MELYIYSYIYRFELFFLSFFSIFHLFCAVVWLFVCVHFALLLLFRFVCCFLALWKASMLSPLQTVPLKLIAFGSIHSPAESDALHNFIFYASISQYILQSSGRCNGGNNGTAIATIFYMEWLVRMCVCAMHQNHRIVYRFFHFKRIILCTSFQYHWQQCFLSKQDILFAVFN